MQPGEPLHCWGPGKEAAFRAYLLTTKRGLRTAASYVRNVRYFAMWCVGRGINVDLATAPDVREYLTELLDSHLSHNTVPLRLSCIRAYYQYVNEQKIREDDPTYRQAVKWQDPPPKRPFTREDVQALLNASRCERDRVMIVLGYDVGLRVSEVVNLREKDVDLERRQICVKVKGGRYVWLPVEPSTLTALEGFFGKKDGILWWSKRGRPLSVKVSQNTFERTGRRAGIRNVHWHRLRTTFACELIDEGVPLEDIQKLMKHKQISTTLLYARHAVDLRSHEIRRGLSRAGRLQWQGRRDSNPQPADLEAAALAN